MTFAVAGFPSKKHLKSSDLWLPRHLCHFKIDSSNITRWLLNNFEDFFWGKACKLAIGRLCLCGGRRASSQSAGSVFEDSWHQPPAGRTEIVGCRFWSRRYMPILARTWLLVTEKPSSVWSSAICQAASWDAKLTAVQRRPFWWLRFRQSLGHWAGHP